MTTPETKSDYTPKGEVLEVYKYPSPILKKVAAPIMEFNQELKNIANNMLYTMYKAPGIGLDAPQIGSSIRLFCIDTEYERESVTNAEGIESYKCFNYDPLVFVNPEIISNEGENTHQEGCLSFPGIFEDVKRFEKITVKYQDIEGKTHSLKSSGLQAICIQHEIDHLNGIVFIERLSPLKRNFILKKLQKKKKKGLKL